MNPHTGEIFDTSHQELLESLGEPVPVNMDHATKKQKEEKKVSLKDHRSRLGRQLTNVRKKRKLGVNDPCSCGSGKKYKKCCKLTEKVRLNKR